MTIRLFTLGGLACTRDGAELDWLGSQWMRAALLVHLTLERSATRDALVALFWPEAGTDTARRRLSQTVFALRKALGEDAIESHGRELRAGAGRRAAPSGLGRWQAARSFSCCSSVSRLRTSSCVTATAPLPRFRRPRHVSRFCRSTPPVQPKSTSSAAAWSISSPRR